MAVYFVQGKLGAGKSLIAVSRMQKALNEGRKVATNINLNLEYLINPWAKNCTVIRVPDKPMPADFDGLPIGYEGKYQSEESNGDLHLDECGIWFNSRNWNDKGRAEIITWIIHARKRRWNIYFYVQDIEVVDKQAREMFAEHVVTCQRTDRISIPILGFFLNPIFKGLGHEPPKMPRMHLAHVYYGSGFNAQKVDTWYYRGTGLYRGYDTEQLFKPSDHPEACSLHTLLPPYYTYGRYYTKLEHYKNELTNIAIKGYHFFLLGAGLAVLGTNAAVTALPEIPKKGFFSCNEAYKALYGSCDAYPVDKNYKPEGDSKKSSSHAAKPAVVTDGLGQLYVTGSVASGSGYDYFFISDGRPVDLASAGWSFESVDWCTVIIERGSVRKLVNCNPFFLSDSEPMPPESAKPANDVTTAIIEPAVQSFKDNL